MLEDVQAAQNAIKESNFVYILGYPSQPGNRVPGFGFTPPQPGRVFEAGVQL